MNTGIANALIAAGFLTFGIWAIRYSIRRARHLPAAPDNLPPVDDDALIVCRRIARQQTVDPNIARRANRYARDRKED